MSVRFSKYICCYSCTTGVRSSFHILGSHFCLKMRCYATNMLIWMRTVWLVGPYRSTSYAVSGRKRNQRPLRILINFFWFSSGGYNTFVDVCKKNSFWFARQYLIIKWSLTSQAFDLFCIGCICLLSCLMELIIYEIYTLHRRTVFERKE